MCHASLDTTQKEHGVNIRETLGGLENVTVGDGSISTISYVGAISSVTSSIQNGHREGMSGTTGRLRVESTPNMLWVLRC